MTQATSTANLPTSELIEVDKALESMRDSGFDLATAGGEVIDNSYEADATHVRIRTTETNIQAAGQGKTKPKTTKIIEAIAFADNGTGVPYEILPNTLKLGFSTRYNQRNGLGRFGVGMKLAAISQARRIDIFTKPLGSNSYYHAYLDLDEVSLGQQSLIKAEEVEGYPSDYADLMSYPETKKTFESGTLVVWSKVDRLVDGGKYGSAIQERLQDFTKFLARAYRKFISKGFYIELNGKPVSLHDPLFLLENPKVIDNFSQDLRAEIWDEGDIDIDGHPVHVIVTLYPEEFRKIQEEGGNPDPTPKHPYPKPQFKGLYIPENEGKVSLIRNGREIYYDLIPKMLPSGVQTLDRFMGIEVSFPADLDEYFQVRHVKRGAEPVSKLREEVKKFLKRPIESAREEIRKLWSKTETAKQNTLPQHQQAEEAVQRAEKTLPQGKAGMNLDTDTTQQIFADVFSDLEIDPIENPEKAEEVKQKVQELPITIIDSSWPGKELFEITHLNGKAILRINRRHPLIQQVYLPLKDFASRDPMTVTTEEAIELARKAELGLDVLFMAYAKAENMHSNPELYDDLRSYWGQHAHAYTREALGDK